MCAVLLQRYHKNQQRIVEERQRSQSRTENRNSLDIESYDYDYENRRFHDDTYCFGYETDEESTDNVNIDGVENEAEDEEDEEDEDDDNDTETVNGRKSILKKRRDSSCQVASANCRNGGRFLRPKNWFRKRLARKSTFLNSNHTSVSHETDFGDDTENRLRFRLRSSETGPRRQSHMLLSKAHVKSHNKRTAYETEPIVQPQSQNQQQQTVTLATASPQPYYYQKRRLTSSTFYTQKRKETLSQVLNNRKIHAMRYYRIWIYACNIVLFVSALTFCLIACKVLIFDFRRSLVPNLSLTQPSFLYAYMALFTQCGVIQFIGCLGAIRLSEKLINIYWMMLLLFLFGDIVIGLFWIFNYGKICQELKPSLKFKLNNFYGYDSYTTNIWDRLQSEYNCCGVDSVYDYKTLAAIIGSQSAENQSLIDTLVYSTIHADATINELRDELAPEVLRNGIFTVPKSCCLSVIEKEYVILNENFSASIPLPPLSSPRPDRKPMPDNATTPNTTTSDNKNQPADAAAAAAAAAPDSFASRWPIIQTKRVCQSVHSSGCTSRMVDYIEDTANILFIFGYCVVAFIKLCFIGILKYEIKEMIQKMRVLKIEMMLSDGAVRNNGMSSGTLLQTHHSNLALNNCQNDEICVESSGGGGGGGGDNSGDEGVTRIHSAAKTKFCRKYESTESERETLLNDMHYYQQQQQHHGHHQYHQSSSSPPPSQHQQSILNHQRSTSSERLGRCSISISKSITSQMDQCSQKNLPQQPQSQSIPFSGGHCAKHCSLMIMDDDRLKNRKNSLSSYELQEFIPNCYRRLATSPPPPQQQQQSSPNQLQVLPTQLPGNYNRRYRMSSPDTTLSQNI